MPTWSLWSVDRVHLVIVVWGRGDRHDAMRTWPLWSIDRHTCTSPLLWGGGG